MRYRILGVVTASALAAAAAPAAAATLPLAGTLDLADAPAANAARWAGSEKGGLAGASVAGIGDFDGDGRADVAVGEPKRDTAGGAESGAVHIVTAARGSGSLDDGAKAIRIRGARAGDNAGFDVAAAGDVNGDGLADVLVGAPLAGGADASDQAGAAYLVFGRRDRGEIDLGGDFGGVRIRGAEAGSWLGRSLASLPDVTGDGRPELVVGAPKRNVGDRRDAGSAYVIFGRAGGGTVDVSTLVSDGAGYRIDGAPGSAAGGALTALSLSTVGDLNGDGRAELLVGAPRAPGGAPGSAALGRAYVVRGRPTPGIIDLAALAADEGYAISGAPNRGDDRPGPRFGESVSGVGDVNGDTLPDLVVGSHLANGPDRTRAGIAYVVFGKADTAGQDAARLGDGGYRIVGVSPDDQTGAATAAAGDFNADGLADVAVGAPFAGPLSRTAAGAVYVVYGRRGEQRELDLAEIGDRGLRIAGGEGDVTGFAIDNAGDVDGDGGPDLVIGAVAIDADYLANTRTTKAGSAAVVFGAGEGQQPGAELVNDPGYQEELARGCRPALNVQAVIEDNSYTDDQADRERIRLDGMQAYVATPRNFGTVVGISAFAADDEDDEDGGAVPLVEPTQLSPGRVDQLKKVIFDGIKGEDAFPGYEVMFTTLADDNPSAGARIMLVDGVTFEEIAELDGLTDGSAPTYVVAVGTPPDRTRDDVRQMRRVTRETKGRYYESRSPRQLERALQAIQSRIRCDLEADNFRENLDPEEEAEVAETELEEGAHTADITLTWREEDEDYEIDEIQILDEEGDDVIREIDEEELDDAYEESGDDERVVAERGKTFRSLHLRRLRAGRRLRVIARSDDKGSSGRVYARVTQSRRRR